MSDDPGPLPLEYRRPPQKRPKLIEDAEARRWRHRRIVYRCAVFAVFFILVGFYIGPKLYLFGKLTGITTADFVPFVQRSCVPTVRALKEFERDHGHLPDTLQELPSADLPLVPGGQILNGQFWCVGEYNHVITYDFTPDSEGWCVTGAFVNGRIPLPPVKIGASKRSATQPQ